MSVTAGARLQRIPLNTLAIAFGLFGLAETWSAATAALGFAWWTAEPFWFVAVTALVWLVVAHLRRGRHSTETLAAQLRHPAQGPVAAIVPVGITLTGAHLCTFSPPVGAPLACVGVAAAVLFGAWIIGRWIQGPLSVESIHGAYLLPAVAAGYISSQAFAAAGNHALAMAAFGVGALFWLVLLTVVFARLLLGPPLPAPLAPTMAVLVAPPAVGGLAWFALNGHRMDGLAEAFVGVTAFMVLVQGALVPTYRRLTFSLGFWSFTFPLSAAASLAIAWAAITRGPGWQVVVVAALTVVTGVIAAIAVRSSVPIIPGTRRRTTERAVAAAEERQLEVADDLVEAPAHPAAPSSPAAPVGRG
ncbi:transporter [Curtobacterium sp. ISL-83]|uniref:SLAC1 family transporter n=1 Tax=Curtobacterium sp. ISL-83 TaxID=2819145 RepID=UPI001BE4ED15|nr:transporter [Curtobacterium sp. ISL-83]MBT2502851.1 transporter [Curtobacterium sp. ISL-83]